MAYIIDVENGTDRGTITPDVGFRYNINLNTINEAEIKISGSGANRRGLLSIGATVYIYKDGTLVFKGLIDNTDYFVGGTVVFHASGWETWLGKENGAYANSPWTSTASATIFSAIIAESSYLNASTINAGFSMDFRLTTGQSLWNAISNLAIKTSQDVSIDYTTSPVEISILNHVGSSSVVATLNEGIEITNLRKSEGYPRGNIIKVYGKGDGTNQITGTAQDAASIAAYGSITKPVIDRSVMTTAEATRLATALLPLNKDPPKIYDFDLTNPEYSGLSLGDEIKLNALDQDVVNETVRIVGIEEGDVGGVSYKKLQVTNPELKTLMRTKNKILAKIRKDQQDDNSYMQGTSNILTFPALINANDTAPLRIIGYLPQSFIYDEGGNNRVNSFTLDYDVDPYRKNVGNATVNNSLTGAGITNASSVTNAGITNAGSLTGAGITNSSQTPAANSGSLSFAGNTDGQSVTGNYSRCRTYETIVGTPSFSLGRGAVAVVNVSGAAYNVNLTVTTGGGFSGTEGNQNLNNGTYRSYETGSGTKASWVGVFIRFFDGNNNANYQWGTCNLVYDHTHGSHIHSNSFNDVNHTNNNSFNDASHTNSNSFNDTNHDHTATIGDAISDSGSINATEVSEIKVYWWNNGTTSWDLKHTITNTGATIGWDLDLTNSGALPDAAGFWKVEVKTDNASPDLVQGIMKLKHQIDN